MQQKNNMLAVSQGPVLKIRCVYTIISNRGRKKTNMEEIS